MSRKGKERAGRSSCCPRFPNARNPGHPAPLASPSILLAEKSLRVKSIELEDDFIWELKHQGQVMRLSGTEIWNALHPDPSTLVSLN
jgi:uncharacterized protein YuzE